MIRPHPRYHELYMLRSSWDSSAEQALDRFRPRDLRDLQVWSNLAWVHPLLFEKDPELAEFKAKGRHYTEDEKQWLLDKQRELLAAGDPAAPRAGRARPDRADDDAVLSPDPAPAARQDARARGDARRGAAGLSRRLSRGRRRCTSAAPSRATLARFGEPPRGMWPSEGSVCQALIPLLAEHGIEWIATDEEILGCSTGGKVGRDSRGHVRHPELLYRAWKVREAGSRAGDHLPRPFDVRPGRVPLPAQSRPGRGRRLPGQAARHRRRLPAQPGDARPGHPRRRELLGILPRRRRVVPPLALPGRGARPADPAGQGRRVPPRASARSTPCPASSPEAGSATTSPSGSAIPKTTGAGTRCTPPASSWSTRSAPAGTIRPSWPGPGTRSTSPRAPTGSGGTATTIRAPWTACSTTCSASTCAMSTRCWAATRPGSLFTPISQAGGHRPLHDQPISFLERQGRRPGHLLRVDRRGAIRLRQRPRDDDAGRPRACSSASGSGSTPSGS